MSVPVNRTTDNLGLSMIFPVASFANPPVGNGISFVAGGVSVLLRRLLQFCKPIIIPVNHGISYPPTLYHFKYVQRKIYAVEMQYRLMII
jgi:hypothetical protein